ncbi:hypothetical protein [Aliihoeflea sp. PC F10.4]
MERIAIGEGARHLHLVEIFEAGEPAETFTTIGDLLFGIECVE